MQTITLQRDGYADIRFVGEQIAHVSSFKPKRTRWTNLTLFRSQSGKLVCWEIGWTLRDGEHDRFTVHVCETEQELIDALGHGWLAKELYEAAGIDAAEDVE